MNEYFYGIPSGDCQGTLSLFNEKGVGLDQTPACNIELQIGPNVIQAIKVTYLLKVMPSVVDMAEDILKNSIIN